MSLPDVPVSPPVSHSLSRFRDVEARSTSLEYQLHLTEYRIRRDLLERDRAWRDQITSAMSLVCRMLAAAIPSSPRRHDREDPVKAPGELPMPDLEPRPITLEEYHAHAPEKFELLGGYLFRPADDADARRRLLGLLLKKAATVFRSGLES